MARKPRTPVYFPRMKVRGRRNKAKIAARHTNITIIPYARPVQIPTGYRFEALAEPQPGSMRLQLTSVTDGFGRTVTPHQLDRIEPVKPTPDPTFSVKFKLKDRMSAGVWDTLFGRERDGT